MRIKVYASQRSRGGSCTGKLAKPVMPLVRWDYHRYELLPALNGSGKRFSRSQERVKEEQKTWS